MRSLYWLTAITLVAAAVTTVAIADYGRRHPHSFAGVLFGSSSKATNTVTERCSPDAVQGREDPSVVVSAQTGPCPVMCNSTSTCDASTSASCSTPASCASVPQTPVAMDVASVPEHQKLREQALRELQSLQVKPETVTLEKPSRSTAVKVPAEQKSDEFSFDSKPLVPLYVPLAPEAKVIVPPPSIVKEVVQLPNIPGVSAGNQVSTPRPETFEVVRGPEVMYGLHAAAPVTEFNPVQDTLLTLGELLAAINPTTYLMSLPAENVKQKNATVAAATTFAADAPPATTPGVVETEAVTVRECCTPSDTCPGSAKGVSCKVASPGEVVVRTYSVAEFSTTSGTHHEELIRLITTMVSPESWNHKDATMEYFPLGKCLVVRHCVSVQDQVEDLLTQLRNQVIRQQNAPVIRRERTEVTPVELEVVPVVPREDCQQLPRVITVETNRCMDEEVMSLMPITPDGRLVPVPMEPMKGSKAIVPTQYEPAPEDTGWFYDGYLQKKRVSTVPGYFPLFLPYAPLPEAPANYEEQQVQHVSYVRYSMAEVDAIMCSAFESEDKK